MRWRLPYIITLEPTRSYYFPTMERFLLGREKCTPGGSKKSSGSRFTQCPVCGGVVAIALANRHIDSGCRDTKKRRTAAPAPSTLAPGPLVTSSTPKCESSVFKSQQANQEGSPAPGEPLTAVPFKSLPGLFLVDNFLSAEEEARLATWLDSDEGQGHNWVVGSFNGPSRKKKWGSRTDLRGRKFKPPEREMPNELRFVADRMRQVARCPPLRSFRPNEANAISYHRNEGHHLEAHCDDRQLSGAVLVNLSLGGDAIMTYTKDTLARERANAGDTDSHEVLLKRRSLQVQSGPVRYGFRHGILHRHLLSDRRVSITFRMNALVKEGAQEGCI